MPKDTKTAQLCFKSLAVKYCRWTAILELINHSRLVKMKVLRNQSYS